MNREAQLKKVDYSPILPSSEVLERCRAGLTRQIKKVKTHLERQRLKGIRDEIDFLIDSL